jgi:putative ABC transport system substrate-binding protein
MRRRELIVGLGILALSGSARAQSAKLHRIGVLDTSARALNANFREFLTALRELGRVEGEDFTVEYRSADSHNERFADLAAELVRRDVDLIVTRGTPAALAAKSATTKSATTQSGATGIPVIMAAVGDPRAIVASAGRAANLTGFGANLPGTERRRVELLKMMLPRLARIGALMNLSNPSRQAEWESIAAAARSLEVAPLVLDTRARADIARAFDAASLAQTDAVVVGSDIVMQTNQGLLVELAAAHRMPAIYTFRDFVEAGGLMSYGVSLPDLYRRAAGYADKILKGATPRDLPVEPPTKAELVVNRATAKALGLDLPEGLRTLADEVIE